MARILLSGTTGFLGKHLFQYLQSLGHEIFGISSHSDIGNPALYCDIRDQASVESVFQEIKPEVVIHCAAISSVTSATALEYYHVNTVGTENMIRSAVSMPWRVRFIFISTAGVYGNQDTDYLHENLCPKPVHHYGMSKFCAERALINYKEQLDYTIIRPFNIIGEGQSGDFIMPKLVDAFYRRLPVVHLGNINVFRDYIDVLDACELISRLTFNSSAIGEISNLCTGHPVSIKELIAILTEITEHNIDIETNQEFVRKNEVWRLLGDVTKLEVLTGGKIQRKALQQSLRHMLAARSL